MQPKDKEYKIKVMKRGPYLVTGSVPLAEKNITPKGNSYEYTDGRALPQQETYLLCRCGKSKNAPFCDGAHVQTGFLGIEVASNDTYADRAALLQGPDLDLLDDNRCAYARFCHAEHGTAWRLAMQSEDPEARAEAIEAASNCPTGRLLALDKQGNAYEKDYPPSIEILQDPENGVSSGIFVKGSIPIESSSGELYEVRNRAMLCRCGKSRNTPYCDASHIPFKFQDR
jgi:CDGSH-type Zn-finger protein